MRFLMTPQVKKNAMALKRHVSAEFKEYCRSDSGYRLRFRLEGPHQLSSFSSLAFVRNCNIFCSWNGQRQSNWRVRLGPMRVTDKRLTHFLFPRDLSRLPQLESLLAGYVLPSQFVDDSYTSKVLVSPSQQWFVCKWCLAICICFVFRQCRFSQVTMIWKSDI